jgi:hypothetical protein
MCDTSEHVATVLSRLQVLQPGPGQEDWQATFRHAHPCTIESG